MQSYDLLSFLECKRRYCLSIFSFIQWKSMESKVVLALNDFHCMDKNSSLKYLLLCSIEERKFYRFGMTLGWVNDDKVFILVWTVSITTRSSSFWSHFGLVAYIWRTPIWNWDAHMSKERGLHLEGVTRVLQPHRKHSNGTLVCVCGPWWPHLLTKDPLITLLTVNP